MKIWETKFFMTDLLNDPKIYFVAGYKNEKIECGCLLNRTADVLGISNFFAPESNIEYWSEIIKFIFDTIKLTDIIGYERKDFSERLKDLGFEAIGNLTVWLRKSETKL